MDTTTSTTTTTSSPETEIKAIRKLGTELAKADHNANLSGETLKGTKWTYIARYDRDPEDIDSFQKFILGEFEVYEKSNSDRCTSTFSAGVNWKGKNVWNNSCQGYRWMSHRNTNEKNEDGLTKALKEVAEIEGVTLDDIIALCPIRFGYMD